MVHNLLNILCNIEKHKDIDNRNYGKSRFAIRSKGLALFSGIPKYYNITPFYRL